MRHLTTSALICICATLCGAQIGSEDKVLDTCLTEVEKELDTLNVPEEMKNLGLTLRSLSGVMSRMAERDEKPAKFLIKYSDLKLEEEEIRQRCERFMSDALIAMFKPSCSQEVLEKVDFFNNLGKYELVMSRHIRIEEFMSMIVACEIITG